MKKILLTLLVSLTLVKLYAEDQNFVLMLDCSASMKDKIANLKASVKKFLELTPSCANIAIYSFGVEDFILFTKDKAKLNAYVDKMNIGGSTPMYACFQKVYDYVQKTPVKAICLFTDGEPTDKAIALRTDIPIYSIGVGLNDKGQEIITKISAKSGGETYLPNNIQELEGIFVNLSVRLSAGKLSCDILEDKDTSAIKKSAINVISGFYYYKKSEIYVGNDMIDDLRAEKDSMVEVLKKEGCPNAMHFDNNKLKILRIDDHNKSEWVQGSYTLVKDLLSIKYVYQKVPYKIDMKILNASTNLVMKVVGLSDKENEDLLDVGSIYIYLTKDKCAE